MLAIAVNTTVAVGSDASRRHRSLPRGNHSCHSYKRRPCCNRYCDSVPSSQSAAVEPRTPNPSHCHGTAQPRSEHRGVGSEKLAATR
jgi:hypothetical protein